MNAADMSKPFLLAIPVLLLACSPKTEKYFEQTKLPDQVVPLYNEVAAFKSQTSGERGEALKRKVKLDLAFLVKNSKAQQPILRAASTLSGSGKRTSLISVGFGSDGHPPKGSTGAVD
jgi:hypothetical protein